MDSHPIVVTGVGVVAPNGIGKEAFWQSCFAGQSGIRPITLFDVSSYRCHLAGEVDQFQPQAFLGSRGLRTLDRTTCLALVAAKLALEDAGLAHSEVPPQQIGIVLGSTMGSLRSISEFDLEGLREGARYVNPALFPNAVINSPASQVSIRFKLQGLNTTIATGFTASLDAIGYALDMLRLGRAQVLIVGGVEELCLQTFLGFYKLGLLATGSRRPGTLLGEGAACLVLESRDHAVGRGATPCAEVAGYGTAFHHASLYRHDPSAASAAEALRHALLAAEVSPEQIDYVSACANSTTACDAMERTALRTVLGDRASSVPVHAVKALVGESFSAGGALQAAVAIGALVHQRAPAPLQTALVQSVGFAGVSSAVVLRRAGRHA